MNQCPYCLKVTEEACCGESAAHLNKLRLYDIFKDGTCDAYDEERDGIIHVVAKETAPEVIEPHHAGEVVNKYKLWVPNE